MITVHPLGGCPMGADREAGVVNHKGQVFDGDPAAGPQAVHRGLYVSDGSIIPRPLGVNPFLTISGLTERAMIHLAEDYGLRFDDAPKADAPRRFAGREKDGGVPLGVEFTERMAGFISIGATGAYDAAGAARAGSRTASSASPSPWWSTTWTGSSTTRSTPAKSRARRCVRPCRPSRCPFPTESST